MNDKNSPSTTAAVYKGARGSLSKFRREQRGKTIKEVYLRDNTAFQLISTACQANNAGSKEDGKARQESQSLKIDILFRTENKTDMRYPPFRRDTFVERWLDCINIHPNDADPGAGTPNEVTEICHPGTYCLTGKDKPQDPSLSMLALFHLSDCICVFRDIGDPRFGGIEDDDDDESHDDSGDMDEKDDTTLDSVEALGAGLRDMLKFGNDFHPSFLR